MSPVSLMPPRLFLMDWIFNLPRLAWLNLWMKDPPPLNGEEGLWLFLCRIRGVLMCRLLIAVSAMWILLYSLQVLYQAVLRNLVLPQVLLTCTLISNVKLVSSLVTSLDVKEVREELRVVVFPMVVAGGARELVVAGERRAKQCSVRLMVVASVVIIWDALKVQKDEQTYV